MDIRPNLIRYMIGTVQSASRFALSDIRFVWILTRIQLLLPNIPLQLKHCVDIREKPVELKKRWQQEEVKRFSRKSPFFLCEVEEKVQFHWRMCISFLTLDHIPLFFFDERSYPFHWGVVCVAFNIPARKLYSICALFTLISINSSLTQPNANFL